MKKSVFRRARKGILTFEWILIFVLLVIGTVGGIAVLRDAIIIKAADAAQATVKIDASYTLNPAVKMQLHYNSTTKEASYATGSSFQASDVKVSVGT